MTRTIEDIRAELARAGQAVERARRAVREAEDHEVACRGTVRRLYGELVAALPTITVKRDHHRTKTYVYSRHSEGWKSVWVRNVRYGPDAAEIRFARRERFGHVQYSEHGGSGYLTCDEVDSLRRQVEAPDAD